MEYKRDRIVNKGKTLANIKRDRFCAGTGSISICNIKDERVREKTTSTVVCNVKNGDIREKTSSKRLVKVKDVRKEIKNSESLSDTFVAAVWHYFLR